jgi:hypothetical protein
MSVGNEKAYWAAVRQDLMVFLHQAFASNHAGSPLMDNWHIEAIVGALERAISGQERRLILNAQPRIGKSFIVSAVLPAFVLGHDPSARIICVSYSEDLALALARDCRRLMDSPWYRQIFSGTVLTKRAEGELVTDKGGYRLAVSTGGTLTGRGADFIIVDDPIKPEDAYSDLERNRVNGWYGNTLLSRLDDKQRGVLIQVAQRLHPNDLSGFLEAGGGFTKLSLPAIASKTEHVPLRFDQYHLRRAGEVLHEEREGLAQLEALRHQMGEFNFAAQYQQQPQAPEGALFQRSWLPVVDKGPRRGSGQWYLSLDTAASTAETADFTALSLVYHSNDVFYVLLAERGRWTYEQQVKKVEHYINRFGELNAPIVVIFEYASTGISLYSRFADQREDRARFHYYKPKTGKMGRAAQALPIFAGGRVRLVRGTDDQWMEAYLNEFISFPFGRFDDWVDSLSQLVCWAKNRGPIGPGCFLC